MKRLVLGMFGAVLACGPSFQTIYENDARFEHCYALDESGASLQKKANCWQDWKTHHVYGQTRDRVEYAQSRYVALSQVNDVPTDEAMMHAAPGEVGESGKLTAPTPTNAFAPPEAMATVDAGATQSLPTVTPFIAPPPTATATATVRPPGAACSEDCARAWQECKASGKTTLCDGPYDRCVIDCLNKK